MKLVDVKGCGEFCYLGCADEKMSKRLVSFGFIVGVKLKVVGRMKSGFVVDVLGSKFAINSKLASAIILEKAATNAE